MKVVTIGGATIDIFITAYETSVVENETRDHPTTSLNVPGEKVEVEEIFESTGGGSTNAAVAFSRLGFDVSCLCKVGHDHHGKIIKKALDNENVDTRLIIKSKADTTGTSYIIRTKHGNHVIFAHRGVNGTIEKGDVPYKCLENADLLYITSLSQRSASTLLPICEFAKKQNIPVALNPGRTQISENANHLINLLKSVHILILNSREAIELLKGLGNTESKKAFAPTTFFEKIRKIGTCYCVVTAGADGAYVSDGIRILFHPSPKADVVDTVGAGDSFGSTFAASIMKAQPIDEALKRSLVASRSVIERLGAKTGLLTENQIEKKVVDLDTSNIVELL